MERTVSFLQRVFGHWRARLMLGTSWRLDVEPVAWVQVLPVRWAASSRFWTHCLKPQFLHFLCGQLAFSTHWGLNGVIRVHLAWYLAHGKKALSDWQLERCQIYKISEVPYLHSKMYTPREDEGATPLMWLLKINDTGLSIYTLKKVTDRREK